MSTLRAVKLAICSVDMVVPCHSLPLLCLGCEGRRMDDDWDGSVLKKSLTDKAVVCNPFALPDLCLARIGPLNSLF